ncbi:MAG: thermopsin family protease [Vulcanisaeta sp.]|uniref:thermopsin family protease n=1 Tax=Vulcanisaeta sp. TaxID=2020871 RepID=UPI003D0AAEB0
MVKSLFFLVLFGLILISISLNIHAQVQVPPPQPNVLFVPWNVTLSQPEYVVVYAGGCSPGNTSTYVFTPGEYDLWYSGQAVNAVYAGTLMNGKPLPIQLSQGNYVVVVYPAPSNYATCLYLTYGPSFGMGIVSLPLQPIRTNEVLGYFNISRISAYNTNGANYGVPNSGAGLQLNVVLVVDLVNGQKQYYWLQNVIQFLTHSQNYDFLDNVWNDTTALATLTSIAGNGVVSNSTNGVYYGYQSGYNTYNLPFAGYLIINVFTYYGTVIVQFGYVITQSSLYQAPQVVWYDKVYIRPYAPASRAYIEVYANNLTPAGYPMDAELVFTGYANGELTTFSNVNAKLALVYWNNSTWSPFPSVYSFSLDTLESATNLRVSMPGSFAVVTVDKSNLGLINPNPQAPALPMTFINITYPTGSSALYIIQTYRAVFPPVIQPQGDVRYVFEGYYLNSEFYSNSSITLYPSQTWFTIYNITAAYQAQYFVSINSVLPVSINGTETTSYSNWVNAGSVLSIIVNNVTLSNETLFVPSLHSETLSINSPITLTINWTPYYHVEVTSNYPINVNGVSTTNFTSWVRSGSQLVVTAKPINELMGLVTLEPNATSLTLAINEPTTITITYTPNYTNLIITITVVLMLMFVFMIIRTKRH